MTKHTNDNMCNATGSLPVSAAEVLWVARNLDEIPKSWSHCAAVDYSAEILRRHAAAMTERQPNEKPKDPAAGWTHERSGVWVPPRSPERSGAESRVAVFGAEDSSVKLVREMCDAVKALNEHAESLGLALEDAITTLRENEGTTLVTAERQETWISVLAQYRASVIAQRWLWKTTPEK